MTAAEKRKHGGGSLVRRGVDQDGIQIWELRAHAGYDPGTQTYRRVTRSFHGTETQARRELAKLVVAAGAQRQASTAATVAEVLDLWIEQARSAGLEDSTLVGYQSKIRHHIKPAIGSVPLRKLTAGDIDRMYRALTRQGLAPATVRQVHAIVRKALGQAVRWGWAEANPALAAQPPRLAGHEIRPPDPSAVRAAFDVADARDPELGVFLRLSASLGARRGEVSGLRWADIDRDDASVTIRRSVYRHGGETKVKGTKTRQVRLIAVGPAAMAALDAHRARMVDRAGEVAVVPDAYIFSPDLSGKAPWPPDHWSGAWTAIRGVAGLPSCRLHDLRHLAATQMLADGVDVRTVAGRLGHANAATTLSVYSHFLPAKDRDAAERLERILAGG